MKALTFFSGLGLVGILAFGAGMLTREKEWAAWERLVEVRTAVRSFRSTGLFLPDLTFYRRAKAGAARHVILVPEKASPGYWLINRFAPETGSNLAELIDRNGSVLHKWVIDYSRLVEGGARDEFAHAIAVLPDGSLLINFDDGQALARLDSCSDPVWVRQDYTFHHSFSPDENGGYWTWAGLGWDGAIDQHMLRFDTETGETIESISLIKDVLKDDMTRFHMTFPQGFNYSRGAERDSVDYLHPNDIEPLPASMASAFPNFEAGDLLVSFRNIHMIGVIDRDEHVIKWSGYGPWRDQHDPDFTPAGTITVYSNNQERFRSAILEVMPTSGQAHDVFAGSDLRFSSFIMGTHQVLPNGNRLIVSSMQGRIIEVTEWGELVREFNNIINDTHNSIIPHAEVVPLDYFDEIPSCS